MGDYLPLIATAVLLIGTGAGLVYAGSTRTGRVITGAEDLEPVPTAARPPLPEPEDDSEAEMRQMLAATAGAELRRILREHRVTDGPNP